MTDQSENLPAAPQIFHGRTSELQHLVDCMKKNVQGLAVIGGPAGIGKSTLAQSLLHDDAVTELYDFRRYLVACDTCYGLENLVQRISTSLGLPHSGAPSKHAIVSALEASQLRSLLILDDLGMFIQRVPAKL